MNTILPEKWIINPLCSFLNKKPKKIYIDIYKKNEYNIKCIFDNTNKKNKIYNLEKMVNKLKNDLK
jgi:hypothetical protein